MALHHVGYIDLPLHSKPGGFDHAAVHRRSRRVYVAHTANDAIDVIDGLTHRYVGSIPDLTSVAGALVCDEHDHVFTSNRGENTVGIFSASDTAIVAKVGVGVRPNGLAYDPGRRRLLAANVGDPAIPGSFTVSVVDVDQRTRIAEIPSMPRTRKDDSVTFCSVLWQREFPRRDGKRRRDGGRRTATGRGGQGSGSAIGSRSFAIE